MGHGAWGDVALASRRVGDEGDEEARGRGQGRKSSPLLQCPIPNAQYPIPNAQCPMPYSLYREIAKIHQE